MIVSRMKYSLCLVLLISSLLVLGQDSTRTLTDVYKTTFWINLGSGWGGQQWAGSASIGINPINKWVFAAAIHGTDFSTAISIFNSEDGIRTTSYEFLVGRIQRSNNITMYATVGLGLMEISEITNTGSFFIFPTSDIEKSTTIGIPLNTYIFVHNKFIGAGLELFLNINTPFPYGGFVIHLYLGKLR